MTRIRVPHEQTLSSLDDSTYEVLGDSSLIHSDDELDDGNTASLTSQSVDGRTPDDLSSIADTEASHAEDEQFENISRPDEGRGDDLQESVYPSSDDEDGAAHLEPETVRQSQALRRPDNRIEASDMTARPDSPDMDVAMTPSLQHLRGQDMTESELFEHHRLPQPRALTLEDMRVFLERVARQAGDVIQQGSREVAIAMRHLAADAKRATITAQHTWKTVKLTYQANMQNRESLAFFFTVAVQILLGLSLVALVGWVSAHLTITFHGKVRSIDASGPGRVHIYQLPEKFHTADVSFTSESLEWRPVPDNRKPAVREPITSTSLGEPMQPIPVQQGPELVARIVGDNHILLAQRMSAKPPRRVPKLSVTVNRNGQKLNATISQLEAVYTIEIDREQAWGVVDVVVKYAKSNAIAQDFQVNFGNPWLKMSVWTASAEKLSRNVRDEWAAVNGFLSQTVQQAAKELKDFQVRHNTDEKAARFRQDSRELADALVERATTVSRDLTRVASAQSKALGSHLASLKHTMAKEVPKTTLKIQKEISRLYCSLSNAGQHNLVRDARDRHAHLLTRARTNAEHIVKKLQRKQARMETRLREKFDKAALREERKAKKASKRKTKRGRCA